MSQQQNSSRAVLTQIGHEPDRLKAQGQSTELLFGPGLLNERVHTRFKLKLSRCSAAANSGFACTELLSGLVLPTDWAYARFELELPCYCSAAAKNRPACTELLSGRGLPNRTGACSI